LNSLKFKISEVFKEDSNVAEDDIDINHSDLSQSLHDKSNKENKLKSLLEDIVIVEPPKKEKLNNFSFKTEDFPQIDNPRKEFSDLYGEENNSDNDFEADVYSNPIVKKNFTAKNKTKKKKKFEEIKIDIYKEIEVKRAEILIERDKPTPKKGRESKIKK